MYTLPLAKKMYILISILMFWAVNSSRMEFQSFKKNTKWDITSVYKTVNISMSIATEMVPSLAACGHLCSTKLAMQVMSLYYIQPSNTCHCNSEIDTRPEETSGVFFLYGELKYLFEIAENVDNDTLTTLYPFKLDCKELFQAGFKDDGFYAIKSYEGKNVNVKCDMLNGGWTIIQRRLDGSEEFYRDWVTYTTGFGNVTGEYWIGLENMHHLTHYNSEALIYIKAHPGMQTKSLTARYSYFKVENSSTQFILRISGYNGTCGNSMQQHNGQKFTTFDRDNDLHTSINCAVSYTGAWWYKYCLEVNLNGYYYPENTYVRSHNFGKGIHWYDCWQFWQSARETIMKIKRL